MRGGREKRQHCCEGGREERRCCEGEAAAVLDVGLRGVVMGLLVGWALHSSWAFSLFFLLFSFLFPFILLIILLICCFNIGVWRRLASPRRPEEVGRHTSPQRLKNIGWSIYRDYQI